MNLLLLEPHELDETACCRLTGRRLQHARSVLHLQEGDELKVGVRGGLTGTGRVLLISREELVLQVALGEPPPPRLALEVLLAMPRPKALKRLLPALASLGVGKVVLVNAARVESSYFDSKVLESSFVQGLFDLGLEQARDTVSPALEVRPLLRPFVEDELDAWATAGAVRLVLHPTAASPAGRIDPGQPLCLAIGPDGGWVPFEVELLASRGFTPVTLGPRPLRVEVAVPVAIGALRQGG